MAGVTRKSGTTRITTKPWIIRFEYPSEFENVPSDELPICGENYDRVPTDLIPGDIYIAYGAKWLITGREITGKPGDSHKKNRLSVAIALFIEKT